MGRVPQLLSSYSSNKDENLPAPLFSASQSSSAVLGKEEKHYLIETADKGGSWHDDYAAEGEGDEAFDDVAGSCGATCEDHLSCPESCSICRTETIEEYDTGVKSCHTEPH